MHCKSAVRVQCREALSRLLPDYVNENADGEGKGSREVGTAQGRPTRRRTRPMCVAPPRPSEIFPNYS
jgi:hypothetical protein